MVATFGFLARFLVCALSCTGVCAAGCTSGSDRSREGGRSAALNPGEVPGGAAGMSAGSDGNLVDSSAGASGGSASAGQGAQDNAGDGDQARPDHNTSVGTTDESGRQPEPIEGCVLALDPQGSATLDLSLTPKWQWIAPAMLETGFEMGMPLVANLSDDNADGVIDTRDTPDVVTQAFIGGQMFVLDGASGAQRLTFASPPPYGSLAAIGDLEGDGEPEIIAYDDLALTAFNHDGSIQWQAPAQDYNFGLGTVSLADLDHDGELEILSLGAVYDARGELRERLTDIGAFSPAFAADIEGDSDLEVIFGGLSFHFDGTSYVETSYPVGGSFMQLADLDGDGAPEMVSVGEDAVFVVELDGTVIARATPADLGMDFGMLYGPVLIADLDGDGAPEIGIAGETQYVAFRADLTPLWITPTARGAYVWGASAFDFDGDGAAEIVYADQTRLHLWDGSTGIERAGFDLNGSPGIGYPVVADVDNDGSAEIVLSIRGAESFPSRIVALGAAQGHFMPARRIWNQYAYYVSHVTETGTAPDPEPQSWRYTNTFRTQASVNENGHVCLPGGALPELD